MINNINLLNEFWEYVETEAKKTKIAKKILNWLDCDNLGNIVLDNNIYWLENTCSYTKTPDYIFNYIKKWCNKKGYTYLFDIPTKF